MTFKSRMPIQFLLLLVAPIWITANPTAAEVYRYKDANGNVVFSDQPMPGAEKIEVQEPATISLPKPTPGSREPKPSQEDQGPRYQTLSITFPGADSSFHSGNGDFTVTTNIEPPLSAAHDLRLLVDGQIYATGNSGTFAVTNLDRGTHSLQLQVADHEGKLIQNSSSVSFTIHRPSAQNPNRPAPHASP